MVFLDFYCLMWYNLIMNSPKTSSVQDKFPAFLERTLESGEPGFVYPPIEDGEFKPEIVAREGVVCLPQFWELDDTQATSIAASLGDEAVRVAMYTVLAGDSHHDTAVIELATRTGRDFTMDTYDDPMVRNPENRPSAVVYNRITLQSQLEGMREGGDIDTLLGLLDDAARTLPGISVLRGGVISEADKDALAHVNEAAFDGFTEYHPGNQAESREEFMAALDDVSTTVLCSRDQESDEIDGFMYFGTSIDAMPWLNAQFYAERDTGHNQLFFTSIGSVDPRGGRGVGVRLMETFAIAFSQFRKPLDVYFQCTNRSNEIVVPLVRGYAARKQTPTTVDELARVEYRAINFAD